MNHFWNISKRVHDGGAMQKAGKTARLSELIIIGDDTVVYLLLLLRDTAMHDDCRINPSELRIYLHFTTDYPAEVDQGGSNGRSA